jgi:fluoride exporter
VRPSISLTPRQLVLALGVVAGGGALGTALRDLLTRAQPAPGTTDWVAYVPWALLGVNALGAYAATWILRGPLRQHDPNDPWRLVVITGFLGGLTSYSGLFVDIAAVWHRCVGGGLLVAVGGVASGAAAAALGLLGHRHAHGIHQ